MLIFHLPLEMHYTEGIKATVKKKKKKERQTLLHTAQSALSLSLCLADVIHPEGTPGSC